MRIDENIFVILALVFEISCPEVWDFIKKSTFFNNVNKPIFKTRIVMDIIFSGIYASTKVNVF